ncbi:MAG TPA: hypothetical protein VFA88_05665 [Gaiellaceae bacterium]|nr:hypothetical protein [Gaiellaceae bacterium]
MGEHEAVIDEINAVLASSLDDRARMERMLTDGYAHALSLEAERSRVLKELRALAAASQGGDLEEKTRELSELARRIELQDVELTRLRELLVRLRAQYRRADAAPSR